MLQLECDIKHNICKLYLFVYKDISPPMATTQKTAGVYNIPCHSYGLYVRELYLYSS